MKAEGSCVQTACRLYAHCYARLHVCMQDACKHSSCMAAWRLHGSVNPKVRGYILSTEGPRHCANYPSVNQGVGWLWL